MLNAPSTKMPVATLPAQTLVDPAALAPFTNPEVQPKAAALAHLIPSANPAKLLNEGRIQAGETFKEFNDGEPARDYNMARTQDTLLKAGGAALATLAALGSGSLIFGLKEVLGVATWFGLGMTVPPLVIDKVFKAKTGVNFQQNYSTSYNVEERESLYNDPQYLPLHLLSDEQLHAIGDKAGIDRNLSLEDYKRDVRHEIQKTIAQRDALWMLTAGGMTPLLTAGIAHLAEPVVERVVLPARQAINKLPLMLSGGTPQALGGYADGLVGDHADSLLAQWWRGFDDRVLGKLKFNTGELHSKELLNAFAPDSKRSLREQAIAKHFLTMPDAQRDQLMTQLSKETDRLLQFADAYRAQAEPVEQKALAAFETQVQQGFASLPDNLREEGLSLLKQAVETERDVRLDKWKPLDLLLNFSKEHLHDAGFTAIDDAAKTVEQLTEKNRFVLTRLLDAYSSVGDYERTLIKAGELGRDFAQASAEQQQTLVTAMRRELAAKTEKTVTDLTERQLWQPIQDVLRVAQPDKRESLIKQFLPSSDGTLYNLFLEQSSNRQFTHASPQISQSVMQHAEKALKNTIARGNWRRNVALLAGSMVVGAGLYLTTMVGKRPSEKAPLAEPLNAVQSTGPVAAPTPNTSTASTLKPLSVPQPPSQAFMPMMMPTPVPNLVNSQSSQVEGQA